MNRHFRTFHEGKEEDKEGMENYVEDDSSSSSGNDDESRGSEAESLERNEAFRRWLDEAREAGRPAMGERLEKYLARGAEEADAEEKARWKTTPEIKAKFFDDYETHLWEYKTLEFNDVHRDVLDTLEERLSDGVDIHHAIKRAVAKHKHEFEGLFQDLDEDSEDDEDPQQEEEEEDPDDPSVRMVWNTRFEIHCL